MKISKRLILVCTFSLLFTPAFSQATKVTGRVFDVETREPMPFVNLLLKGTRAGVNTDFDGNYSISTEERTDSLIVVYTGYIRVARPVKQGVSQIINIDFHKNTVSLTEVVVKAGENPAHRILRKVIANKDRNDKEKLDAYQYEAYNKIEFDITNISEEAKNSRVLKPVKFIFDYIDSSDAQQKPFLPMFLSESVSDYFYRRNPKYKKEIIKGSKVSGFNDPSIAQFTGDLYQNVNIYDNNILVFGKNFVSPISDNGLLFYKYYLIDSVVLNGTRCYQLQFKPRRKQELTFSGNMWIADTAFAVKRLEMSIAPDANINFVNMLNVVQEYKKVDSTWMMSKDRLVIDFVLKKGTTGFYGRKTTSYKDFKINQLKEEGFYTITDNLVVEQGAENRNDEFWANSRHDTLSKNEKQIYKMVDTIQSLPVYKTWVDIVTIFFTGYKVIDNYEFGPYYNTLSFNRIEGTRLRIGGRTSDKFSQWYELNGYVAYGFLDEKFKYKVGFRSFITKKPRQIISMYYKNDYEILGQSSNAFTQDNILATIFRRNPLTNLTFVDHVESSYEMEWFEGFNTKLYMINRTTSPQGTYRYEYKANDGSLKVKDNITTTEFRFLGRFAYDEKYYEGTFSRASMGTKYPILQVQYSLGLSNFFGGDYDYHKATVNINDRFRINPFGYTDYILEAGKSWGLLPYPMLDLHGGNETYVYDPYAYNMMNYYEFVSDEYFTAQVFHHFDGFFLNKIPLLRKLKWREVLTGKALMGRITNDNRNLLIFPATLNSLNKGPYYEVGAGIENIFKIFRVDALWRLSYLDNPNISKFGIRGSMQLIF